jgi:hypothetical protein
VHVQGSNHFVAPGKINFDISKHRPSTLRATLTNSGKVLRSEAAIQPTRGSDVRRPVSVVRRVAGGAISFADQSKRFSNQ